MVFSHLKTWFLAMLMILLALPSATAQEQEQSAETAVIPPKVDRGPEDALDRGNPRSSIIGFLESTSAFNFEKAAEYLDLRNLPPEASDIGGAELARQLNHVLSRAVWLDDYTVSDSPAGAKGDGLPDYRDELLRVPMPEGAVPIWMQLVPRGDGVKIWKISNRSVALIPELYDHYSYSAPVEKVRAWFPGTWSFLGIEAFKWFLVLAIAIVCWPFYWVIGWILTRIFSSPSKPAYVYVKSLFTGPIVFLAILVTMGVSLQNLGTGAYAQQVLNANTLMTIAVVWICWSLLNLYKFTKKVKLIENGRRGAAKLLQPMTTLLKILISIFGLLFWLNNVGVNITTVLAGLGVGGLAVALALQKPIEDMMGALSIFAQAPIRVGDLCRYGPSVGMIEDIGLRTTRMRTLTNTVISIPNSKMAYAEIENLTYRKKIRYWPTLRLRYDTDPEQIKTLCSRIEKMLTDCDFVYDEGVRVRFTDFADDAILVKVHCFLITTDYPQSLEYGDALNLEIMRIVASEGARFALPGRTISMEGDSIPVND